MINVDEYSERAQKMSDEELLWLVRHKVRRALILAVGEEGRIGATALKQKLGISTGSLYYNLRQMSQLITQDDKKNYVLTDDGLRIYKILTAQSNTAQAIPKPSKMVEIFNAVFFPLWLFSPVYESRVVAAVLGPLSFFVLILVLLAGRYEVFLLNLKNANPFDHFVFAGKLTLTYVIGLLFLSFFSILFSGRFRSFGQAVKNLFKQGLRNNLAEAGRLTASMAVALLPLGLVPGFATVDRVTHSSILANVLVRDSLIVFSQTACIFLLSAAVAYGKKMRWQNSMGVVLTFYYFSQLMNYFT